MKTKYATRKIDRREYETECDFCGCPLTIGDTVYDVEDDDPDVPWTLGVFCFPNCRTRSEEASR